MKKMMHSPIKDQAKKINEMLRGHYNYYGMGGNLDSMIKVYQAIIKYWKKILSKRCWKGYIRWKVFNRILKWFPIMRPKIHIPLTEMKVYAIL
jgi:hypothetical protein